MMAIQMKVSNFYYTVNVEMHKTYAHIIFGRNQHDMHDEDLLSYLISLLRMVTIKMPEGRDMSCITYKKHTLFFNVTLLFAKKLATRKVSLYRSNTRTPESH